MATAESMLNPEVSEATYAFYMTFLPQLFILLLLYGVVSLMLFIFRAASWFHLYFLRTSTLPRYLHGRRYHAWALVTGASDGIGKAFVSELAAAGFNVILHGRNEAKLSALIESVKPDYPDASFRFVVADAGNSHGMKASIEGIVRSLDTLDGPLTVLINNIGGMGSIMTDYWTTMASYSHSDVDTVLNINMRFTTQLTRALLPKLIESKPAFILNSGSLAGSWGTPYLALYSGAKAYLQKWSQALSQELAIEGHDIESLFVIYGTTTGTTLSHKPETLFFPSALTAARGALHKVGCGRFDVLSCGAHALQSFGMILPEFVLRPLYRKIALDALAAQAAEHKKQ